MKRRAGDGCPVTGALQIVGDKWTLLVVRELIDGAKRTGELLSGLSPISSRTLLGRLRDMESDRLIERRNFGGGPPHVEYHLTERGLLLAPLLDALKSLGEALDCSDCEDRRGKIGEYCAACPRASAPAASRPRPSSSRRERDDSIVLL